ncbi:AraC-like DNA-binding protein [Mumia flava]|uniref:AraC-like DNA-binding protein n=1 Tax=Mumia flava TaxID=1348852 RepID=A0A0B2BT31_9ACTN|nr:helix-turn-helix domain-containing protein [Mumia flava]PJJ48314.1 AraC-like DNA-binding protein [Mumia flava]
MSTSDTFVSASPVGPLARAVRAMTGYRQSEITQRLHRGLPSATLTFVLSLDNPVVVGGTADDPSPVAAYALLGPLADRPAYIQQPDHQQGVQLAVHPLASRAIFGVPASRLPGLSLDAADVTGPDVERLRQRIGAEPDWEDRFAAVHQTIARLARSRTGVAAQAPRREVVEGWRWILARGGNGRVDDLAEHVALSSRQLRTVFVEEVGFGPKVLSRLVRFERAVAAIRDAELRADGRHDGPYGPSRLADVAATTGYADHAHLVREFRVLAGTSPTGWLAEERRNIQAGGHRHEAA